jgi:hypothetical protein
MSKILALTFTICLCLLANARICAQSLDSTSLPIILLETNGQTIDFQEINANFKVIDNPAGQVNHPSDMPAYEGLISIRLRGNFSSGLPQKPYAIELLDAATGLDTSVAVLGMPKEEDWILLANWNDKSLVRNPLMFQLARDLGQWAPHTRHVEVLLNGQYQGIYTFCEKIKRDGDRVNVQKLAATDNALPALSGGYIFKHDYGWDFGTDNWHPANCPDRSLNFEMVYPKIEDITPAQFNYLTGYMDDTEEALFSPNFTDPSTGYRKYIDLDSWVDYFLLSELAGNVDAYKKSMYYHKDREGLLKLGSIWDFDWALKFLGENGFPNGAGWLYKVDPCTQDVLYVPYFSRLMQDSFFRQKVCARWQLLRSTQLDSAHIFSYIDSTALALDDAKDRHFQRWQCLGYNSGAPEAPPYPATYAGEVEKLKKFLRQRLAWMDGNIYQVACLTPVVNPPTVPFKVAVLPSIGTGDFVVRVQGLRLPTTRIEAGLYSASGAFVRKIKLGNGDNELDMESSPAGLYFLRANGAILKMVVVR